MSERAADLTSTTGQRAGARPGGRMAGAGYAPPLLEGLHAGSAGHDDGRGTR